MARYYFDIHDGAYIRDEEGTEIASLHDARVAAVELAGSLLREEAAKFWNGEDWQLDVRDEAGLILFSLSFLATDSPALRRSAS